MRNRKPNRGFTLLEVMIALSIFVVVATTMTDTASHSASQVLYLHNKVIASFIAENTLVELQLAGYPEIGKDEQAKSMANRNWKVSTNVMATAFPSTRRVEVSVAEESAPQSPLITLSGVIGEYP